MTRPSRDAVPASGPQQQKEGRRYTGKDLDSFTDDFHKQLGRLVLAHARLDFNIGLQLRWMGPYCEVDVSEFLDPLKTQFAQRLNKLRQLATDIYEPAGAKFAEPFRNWFALADECRALRNDYVHGRWGVPGTFNFQDEGTLAEAEPLLEFVPLQWDLSADRPTGAITMTLDEFAKQVANTERLAADYFRLTEKYRESARWPKASGRW